MEANHFCLFKLLDTFYTFDTIKQNVNENTR